MSALAGALTDDRGRRLRNAGLAVLGLATVIPLVEFLMSVSPMHLGSTAWRFGAMGAFSSFAMGTTVDLLLLSVLATAGGQRRLLVFLAVVSAIFGAFLLAGSALFALDALQTRARVAPGSHAIFDAATGETLVKLGLLALGTLYLSAGAFRLARKKEAAEPARADAVYFGGRRSQSDRKSEPASVEPGGVSVE